MDIKNTEITEDILKGIENSVIQNPVSVSPQVKLKFPDIDFTDKSAVLSFLSKLSDKDNVLLMKMLHKEKYLLICKDQVDRMQQLSEPLKERPGIDVLWNRRDMFVSVFPELEKEFDASVEKLKSGACKGCTANREKSRLVQQAAKIYSENKDRVIPEKLSKLLGPSFGREVARNKYKDATYGSVAVPETSAASKLLTPTMHSHYTEGVRPSCLNCCRKHLAQSIILFQESQYPEYANNFWLGIGHLAEAESEALSSFPEFAKQLRDIRLAMMADKDYLPNIFSVFEDIDMLEETLLVT